MKEDGSESPAIPARDVFWKGRVMNSDVKLSSYKEHSYNSDKPQVTCKSPPCLVNVTAGAAPSTPSSPRCTCCAWKQMAVSPKKASKCSVVDELSQIQRKTHFFWQGVLMSLWWSKQHVQVDLVLTQHLGNLIPVPCSATKLLCVTLEKLFYLFLSSLTLQTEKSQ